MRNMRMILLLVGLFLIATPLLARADTIKAVYTADNEVQKFKVDGAEIADGLKSTGWTSAKTISIGADAPGTHTVEWLVHNAGGTPGDGNPVAFLGQISLNGQTLLSGSSWFVSKNTNGSPDQYVTAVSYYLNSTISSIWGKNNSSKPISGIEGAASWIGMGNFPGSVTDFWVKATYEVPGSAATPIPGAVWLLGSGIVGLIGVRKKLQA